MYQVVDTKTGAVVGSYATSKAARRVRDRKDAQYGACRYAVRLPASS